MFWAGPGEIHNTTAQQSRSITLQLASDNHWHERCWPSQRVQAHAELGLSCKLAQPWCLVPHPNQGGSFGYPIWSQEAQLKRWNVGEETKASLLSLYWWSNRIVQYCCTGNQAGMQIVDTDMINLVVLLFAHPNATWGKIAAHLYKEGGEMYSNQTISKHLKCWVSPKICFCWGISGIVRASAALSLCRLELCSPSRHLWDPRSNAHQCWWVWCDNWEVQQEEGLGIESVSGAEWRPLWPWPKDHHPFCYQARWSSPPPECVWQCWVALALDLLRLEDWHIDK